MRCMGNTRGNFKLFALSKRWVSCFFISFHHYFLLLFFLDNLLLVLSNLKNTTVTDLALVQLIHTLSNTLDGHWELLNDRLDLVESSELKHIPVDLTGSDQRTLDRELVVQERHVRHVHVIVGDGERVDSSTWGHGWEVNIPIWLERSTDQKVVDRRALQLLLSLRSDELGSTKLHCLLTLILRRREDNNTASHLSSELNGQVSKSTNTENTNSGGLVGAEGGESGVDGGTTAHEWGGEVAWDGGWDLVEETSIPDGVGGKGSLVEIVGSVEGAVGAEGLAAGQALLAVHAGVVLVSPADRVALLDGLDVGSDLLLTC